MSGANAPKMSDPFSFARMAMCLTVLGCHSLPDLGMKPSCVRAAPISRYDRPWQRRRTTVSNISYSVGSSTSSPFTDCLP